MKSQAILDQMILVVLNISLWQGRKALKMSDLALNGIDIDKLPPESLATLGSKRIISPKAVKIFISLKRAAKKLCLKNGVRFAGDGYAVPREKIEALSQELQRIKGEFEAAKTNFLSIYVEEVEKWIASNQPEWSPIIRTAVESPNHIMKAISFNYAALDVKAPAEIVENGLDEEVCSLYGQLCHEVRVAARQTFEKTLVGKKEITQKTLSPIKAIREKLVGLLFLDPSITETIQIIDDTLKKLPADVAIKGTDLNMVAGLVGRQLANMGRTYAADEQYGDKYEDELENDLVGEEEGEEQEHEVSGDGSDEMPEEVGDETPEYETIPVEENAAQNNGEVGPIPWDF